MSEPILHTARLRLRRFEAGDAEFVLKLLNEPSFKAYIGDKGVETLADAVDYIEQGPLATFRRYGYGALVVERGADRLPAGMCGLFRRDNLDHPDLGFAILSRFFRQGYATEASKAVIAWCRESLRLPLIAAIVNEENLASRTLIEKLGFEFGGSYAMPDDDRRLRYYSMSLDAPR